MTRKRIVIGTRGSELALWQSHHVKSSLENLSPSLIVELRIIKTLGDKILDSPLSAIGDKSLFTKELDGALLDKTVDLAVHSLKDVPTLLPDGLTIAAVSKREDVHDVFVAGPATAVKSLRDLPDGAKIATGSLRRKCQLLLFRRDLQIVDLRGNLNTRLKKLDASDWAGMILAKAGVNRLGWEHRVTETLSVELMLPAVGQGALAIQTRTEDTEVKELVRHLHHPETACAVAGERSLLRRLEGGCQVPIGTFGRLEEGVFRLDAMIGSLDGRRVIRDSISGDPKSAERLGMELADRLVAQGGKQILDEIRASGTGL